MKVLVFFISVLTLVNARGFNGLSATEEAEVRDRIQRFYAASPTDGSVLSERIPKFNATLQQWRNSSAQQNKNQTLKELAGFKASPFYQAQYCETVLKKHFPSLYASECTGEAREDQNGTIEKIDQLRNLTYSWMAPQDVVYDLSKIPVQGATEKLLWSDDYWKTRWGQTSYRYSTGVKFPNYSTAVAAYAQPGEWQVLQGQPLDTINLTTVRWSPAEKYDLAVGDPLFTLTNSQKALGKDQIGADGDVADWMGICHGWAAASILVPKPLKVAATITQNGATTTWYPADVRAMISLAWANGEYNTNFIGGRCNIEKVELYPNGRIKPQQCFDSNPATVHLALANMIGIRKASFVFDATFDNEVWNQPMAAYAFTYFNPLNPSQTSADWKAVAVDYDAKFKAIDRFQNPLTRGIRKPGKYDDSRIKKVVGVVTSINYLEEYGPPAPFLPEIAQETHSHVNYTYDLELEEKDGAWIPTGGEWQNNTHPDFLWTASQNSAAQSSYDKIAFTYNAGQPASPTVTSIAATASKEGLPLCRVIKEVVKQSAGGDVYPCP